MSRPKDRDTLEHAYRTDVLPSNKRFRAAVWWNEEEKAKFVAKLKQTPSDDLKGRWKFACGAWRAISAAVASTRGPRYDIHHPKSLDDRRHLAKFARRLALQGVNRGSADLAKTIKGWCTEIRLFVFTKNPKSVPQAMFGGLIGNLGWTSARSALQLTYVARALPVGDEGVIYDAIKQHKAYLSSPGTTPDGLLKKIEEFGRSWALKHRLAIDLARLPPVKLSASYGRRLKEGGYASDLYEFMDDQGVEMNPPFLTLHPVDRLEVDSPAEPAEGEAPPPPAVGKMAVPFSFVSLQRDAAYTEDRRRGRVAVVHEMGFKSRIVTAHNSTTVAYLHIVANGFRKALRRDPHLREVMDGDHHGAVMNMFKEGAIPDAMILSADLTSATDVLHRDALEAVLRGAMSTLDDTDLDVEVLVERAVGSYDLHYPALKSAGATRPSVDEDRVVTRRGALMGLPMTWPLLCLLHLAVVDIAIRETRLPNRRLISNLSLGPAPNSYVELIRDTRRQPYAICGDDLIAAMHPDTIARYEDLMGRCGALFSKGKHLTSSRYGIFTEQIFEVEREYRQVKTTISVPALHLESSPLCHAPGPGWVKRDPTWADRIAVRPRRPRFLWLAAATAQEFTPVWTKEVPERRFDAPTRYLPISLGRPRFLGLLPLKWAVRAPSTGVDGSRAGQSLPGWFTIPTAAWSVGESTGKWSRVSRLANAMYPGLPNQLRTAGIPPYLPRSLGGGGLPTPAGPRVRVGKVASHKWRVSLGRLLYRDKEPKALANVWKNVEVPLFSDATKLMKLILSKSRRIAAVRKERTPTPLATADTKGWSEVGDYDAIFESAVGRLTTWIALSHPSVLEKALHVPSLSEFGRRLCKRLTARTGPVYGRGLVKVEVSPNCPVSKLMERSGKNLRERVLWCDSRGELPPETCLDTLETYLGLDDGPVRSATEVLVKHITTYHSQPTAWRPESYTVRARWSNRPHELRGERRPGARSWLGRRTAQYDGLDTEDYKLPPNV
uniref:RNA-dependent RNA polymerase n=1 Tax=Caenorhabditis remanei TaxID=31234 RepID=A0A5P9Q5G0_CAERE|nr:RNA-dependent RNA polymerase [Caenorhabditis remanei]